MNKYVKLVFAATAVLAGTAAQAQNAYTKNVPIQQGKAYVQDSRGITATSTYGNCVRTGFWRRRIRWAAAMAPCKPQCPR